MAIEGTISRNIRLIRQRKGISQKKLAEASGIDVRQISKIENHPAHLSTSTLERIAAGLAVSVRELVESRTKVGEAELPKAMEPGLQEAIRLLKTHIQRIKK